MPESAKSKPHGETRTYRRPAWSRAELGQAANGLGVIPWNAAVYSFAGQSDGYWVLWSALTVEAHRIAWRERWAPQVPTENGRAAILSRDPAALVLDHDAHQHLFAAAPTLYAVYIGVAPPTRDGHLRDPFRSLKQTDDRWLGIARAAIGRWIRED